MRIFLGTHAACRTASDIEQARFLHHRATAFDQIDLAIRLMLDNLHHETHRVDVLCLGTRAEFLAGFAHRDVHVGTHAALFHVAVTAADIAQD